MCLVPAHTRHWIHANGQQGLILLGIEPATISKILSQDLDTENNEGESTLEMGGYYTAELVRIEDNWKTKGWKFTVLWSRGNEQLFELAKQTPNDAYQ